LRINIEAPSASTESARLEAIRCLPIFNQFKAGKSDISSTAHDFSRTSPQASIFPTSTEGRRWSWQLPAYWATLIVAAQFCVISRNSMWPEERVYAYLWDMSQAANEVVDMVAGTSMEEFRKDLVLMRAVERSLEIIGEAARHVLTRRFRCSRTDRMTSGSVPARQSATR
jgi:hypothetical protein